LEKIFGIRSDLSRGKLQHRREKVMCYNCGCGKLDSDMGNPKNITNKTFEEAAKAAKQTSEEGKRKTYETLKKEFEKKK